MTLRISGGEARGRKLKGPRGLDFRPTTGRVKEFIFSILGQDIQNAIVLDLFSGSGSLGIEALSRGASRVTFVEMSFPHLKILEQNLKMCGYQDRSKILRQDVFRAIQFFGRKQIKFHYILADPPFKMAFHRKIVESVGLSQLLDPEGLLIVEHQKDDAAEYAGSLKLVRYRLFGHCMVSIYGPE